MSTKPPPATSNWDAFVKFLEEWKVGELSDFTSLIINIFYFLGLLWGVRFLFRLGYFRQNAADDANATATPLANSPLTAGDTLPTTEQLTGAVAFYCDSLGKRIRERLATRALLQPESRLIRNLTALDDDDNQSQQYDPAEFLDTFGGFVLLGDGGTGKTTTLTALQLALIEEADGHLPLVINVRDIVNAVEEIDIDDADGLTQERAAITAHLWEHISRPFQSLLTNWDRLTSVDRAAQFVKCAKDLQVVVFLDGFDELLTPRSGHAPIKELVLDAISDIRMQLQPFPFHFVVSSRFGEQGLLRSLELKMARFGDIDRGAVVSYITSLYPQLAGHADEIAERFEQELNSRPLYLQPLCNFYRESNSPVANTISRSRLLEAESDRSFDHNATKFKGVEKQQQIGVLMRAAIEHIRTQILNQPKLNELSKSELGGRPTDDHASLLSKATLSLLSSHGDDVEFMHLDHRDYWAACAVLSHVRKAERRFLRDDRLLLIAIEVDSVFDFCLELLAEAPDLDRDILVANLLDIVNSAGNIPANEFGQTTASSAMSLLLRCVPAHEIRGRLDCHSQNLSGLKAREQDLSEFDLTRTNLSRSDLRGADLRDATLADANLNNADLHGANFSLANLTSANLMNCGLGSHRRADGTRTPSQFDSATVDGSDWFNFRVSLAGYRQYWHGGLCDDNRTIAVATNDGSLLHLDPSPNADTTQRRDNGMQSMSARCVEQVDAASGMDLLDFELRHDLGILALAGRQGHSVIVPLHGNATRWDADPDQLQIVTKPEHHFGHYPRRIRISPNGDWACVTDRASNVYFRKLHAASVTTTLAATRVHSGPVMCLFADHTRGRQAFYTAGYDGRIFRHSEPSQPNGDWETELILDLRQGKGRTTRVVRAMIPQMQSGDRNILQGIWIGDEMGGLHYWDRSTRRHSDVDTIADGIFSLSNANARNQLAVGTGSGSLQVFHFSDDARPSTEEIARLQIVDNDDPHRGTRGEIVRAVIQTERWITCVLWSGRIVRWDGLTDSDPVELIVDVIAVAEEETAADRKKVSMRGVDLSDIRGLPVSCVWYLEQLAEGRGE